MESAVASCHRRIESRLGRTLLRCEINANDASSAHFEKPLRTRAAPSDTHVSHISRKTVAEGPSTRLSSRLRKAALRIVQCTSATGWIADDPIGVHKKTGGAETAATARFCAGAIGQMFQCPTSYSMTT